MEATVSWTPFEHEGRQEDTGDITEDFRQEVWADEPVAHMHQLEFWRATQSGGQPDWSSARKTGLEVDFTPDPDGVVRWVTFLRVPNNPALPTKDS